MNDYPWMPSQYKSVESGRPATASNIDIKMHSQNRNQNKDFAFFMVKLRSELQDI